MRRTSVAFLVCALPCCTPLASSEDKPDATEAAAAASCNHAEPPPPPDAAAAPSAPDAAQAESLDLVFAISETEYGSQATEAGPPSYQSIGFDLDHTCTGMGSCVEPSWAIATHHDGVDGIDNAYGEVVGNSVPDKVQAAASAPELLFRVRGYSGQADQDPVEVSLYIAYGLASRQDGGVGPFWDGQDRWTILPEFLQDPGGGGVPSVDQPQFYADRAYVTGGTLVAVFDKTLWSGGLSNAPRLLVTARQLTIAGHLTRSNDGGAAWELRDLVAGLRVGLTDSLNVLGRAPTFLPPDGGAPPTFCQDAPTYQSAKQGLCACADITADPAAPPTAMCDALSTGLIFQAKQAMLGDVAGPAPDLPPCAPGVHPETDTCDALGDQ